MSRTLPTALGPTAVYDNGIRDGTPILYLHGGPGTSDPYKIVEISVQCQVYTYDQYGCGNSWCPEDPNEFSLEMFVEQLREVILRLGLNESGFVLCGSSWGSFLACAYIGKYGTPWVKGLILASPYLDDVHWNRRIDELIMELPEEFSNEIRRCRAAGIYGEETALACRALYSEHYARNGPDLIADTDFITKDDLYKVMFGPAEILCNGKMKGAKVSRYLKDLDIPAMIICGDFDITGPEMALEYAESMKECECVILEDTGHMISRDDLGRFVRLFMDRFSEGNVGPVTGERYLPENGYDVILDPSNIADSPDHERDRAMRMSADECIETARRYENGIGVQRSYYSALIFYQNALDHILKPYQEALDGPGMKAYSTQYDRRDPSRRLILSERGFEAICCEELGNVCEEFTSLSDEDGKTLRWKKKTYRNGSLKNDVIEIGPCPFCGCKLENIAADEKKIDELATGLGPEQILKIGKKYEASGSMKDCIIALGLYKKAFLDAVPSDLVGSIDNCASAIGSLENILLKNVNGTLTRSSVCFESVCCDAFSENLREVSPQQDGFYCDVRLGDTWYMNIHTCPYCRSRVKRVPRHY
ncbi:MAG: alpha/beta fold hydrolase [Candidatus Methanogranum gryphiswaldense]|nr:MAG: alpha/beta fold hydrolase [Candidatus Methanogranum sp. U3.2.1]